ncbi:MAG TPA: DUF5658 family protein [Humisphaera sp.]|nr:DUF5658 family protein [Humisphaera sp.]
MKNEPPIGPGRKLIFQDAYVWLILVSALDIMCTWMILWNNGVEINPLARRLIFLGPKGLVIYKFMLIVFIIGLCEVVGRRNRKAAHILVTAAIGLTIIPVAIALAQLMAQ